jgi:hypothetical protein
VRYPTRAYKSQLRTLTGTCDVVQMRQHPESEQIFDIVYRSLVVSRKHHINISDDCLNVGRAIHGHVFTNGFEIAPEISDGFYDGGRRVTGPENPWLTTSEVS